MKRMTHNRSKVPFLMQANLTGISIRLQKIKRKGNQSQKKRDLVFTRNLKLKTNKNNLRVRTSHNMRKALYLKFAIPKKNPLKKKNRMNKMMWDCSRWNPQCNSSILSSRRLTKRISEKMHLHTEVIFSFFYNWLFDFSYLQHFFSSTYPEWDVQAHLWI